MGLGEGRLSMEKRDEELELGEGQFSDDDDESRIEELERRLDELESTAPVSVTVLGLRDGEVLGNGPIVVQKTQACCAACFMAYAVGHNVIYFAVKR